MQSSTQQPIIAYIVRSYPRLSQTFILNEILALESLGRKIHIFAVTHPHEPLTQAQVSQVQAPVEYLEQAEQRSWRKIMLEHLRQFGRAPWAYLCTLCYLVRHTDFDAGYTASTRFVCFLQAVYLAARLHQLQHESGRNVGHVHAHFAHDPALIAQLVHRLTGIPYSFTAHARDLYQIPASALAERIADANAIVTCCATNIEYLKQVAPAPQHGKLRVIHNGINLQDFQPQPHTEDNGHIPLIISASRLVTKKGYPDLLQACARLQQAGRSFHCVIYGEGPLQGELTQLINELGLTHCVQLAGACTQQELQRVLPQADIFALTPFVTDDGDRDGVPTVLAEAMACGVPVVSTTVAGIPELVTHSRNGLLAAPHDIETVANELALLLSDADQRRQLGAAGRTTIADHFNLQSSAQQLAALFDNALVSV
ncbi:MAG: glycosyltransferase [Caldilineaceae bacterium]